MVASRLFQWFPKFLLAFNFEGKNQKSGSEQACSISRRGDDNKYNLNNANDNTAHHGCLHVQAIMIDSKNDNDNNNNYNNNNDNNYHNHNDDDDDTAHHDCLHVQAMIIHS